MGGHLKAMKRFQRFYIKKSFQLRINFLFHDLSNECSFRKVFNDHYFPSIQLIFVAEFGIYSEHAINKGDELDQNLSGQSLEYSTGSLTGAEVLIIKDGKFNSLQKPFPYFQSIIEHEDRILIVDELVARLNENLYSFNRTATRRILKPKFYKYFHKE